jgi:hypothetical protein
MPPVASEDALALLAKYRGRVCLDECIAAIKVIDRTVGEQLRTATTSAVNSYARIDAVKGIDDLMRRRSIYATRAGSLGKYFGKGKVSLPSPPDVDLAKLLEVERAQVAHLAAQARAAKDQADASVAEAIAGLTQPIPWPGSILIEAAQSLITALSIEIDRVMMQVGGDRSKPDPTVEMALGRLLHRVRNIHPEHSYAGLQQDLHLLKLDAAISLQRITTDRLNALEGSVEASRALVASKVRNAFASSGGVQEVASRIRDALMATDRWWSSHPDHATMVAVQGALVIAQAALGKLEESSPLAADLRAEGEALAAKLATIKEAIDSARKAEVAALVHSALSGAEDARAAVEIVAIGCPRAFKQGFALALADAALERALLSQISAVLT